MATPPNHQRDLQSKINLLIDGELDRNTERELMLQIESNLEIQQMYKSQVALKRTVSEKVTRMSCGNELKESLRSKIRGL
jgi:hypothetical protein